MLILSVQGRVGKEPGSGGLKLPVGLSGNGRKVAAGGVDASRMYKVTSSKAHVVKKTESAQQTDSSAFK